MHMYVIFSSSLQRNVRFSEWFQPEAVSLFHRSIVAEHFLAQFGATHWPPEDRVGSCFQFKNSEQQQCNMKQGEHDSTCLTP